MANHTQNIDLSGTDLPSRLQALREEHQLTKTDLADKAGLSYRTVHDLENHKRDRIQEKTLMLLAQALEVPVYTLLGFEPGKQDQAQKTPLLLLAQALDMPLEDFLNHPPTSSGFPPPNSRHRNRIWVISGIFVIAALAISLGLLWHKGRVRANWILDEGSLVVRDEVFGFKLWELPKNSHIEFCVESPWDSGQLLLGTTFRAQGGGRLFSLNRVSGDTTWIVQPDIESINQAFGKKDVMSANFSCRNLGTGDFDGDGIPEVILKFVHGLYYPCAIGWVGQGGNLLHQYVNKGHLWDYRILDLDHDGKDEIILAGTNNAKAYQGATVIILDDLHFRGASLDPLCDPWSSEPDSALIRLVLPQYPEPYMDLLQVTRLAAWNIVVFEDENANKLLSIDVGGHEKYNRVVVTLDSDLHPISGVTIDSFLERTISQWPDSLKNGTGPGDPVWLAKWLSGYRRFEAGHWPPNKLPPKI
ncbi:MAG: helix-turn-helix domain-containing protein [Gemmatimonadales bacterium]|nr:helix-turn-helix domain-containing protein [Gemmatimonadales bacterium]